MLNEENIWIKRQDASFNELFWGEASNIVRVGNWWHVRDAPVERESQRFDLLIL